MVGRAVWSHPPARRCVAADMASAGPTVALVSEGWWYVALSSVTDDCRWGHERAAKVVFSGFKILSLVQCQSYLLKACSSLISEQREEICHPRFVVALQNSLWLLCSGVCLQNWTRSATTARAQITEGWQAPRSQVESVCRGTQTCCITSSMWAPWMPRLSVASGITPSAGTPAIDDLSCICQRHNQRNLILITPREDFDASSLIPNNKNIKETPK